MIVMCVAVPPHAPPFKHGLFLPFKSGNQLFLDSYSHAHIHTHKRERLVFTHKSKY